MSGLVYIDDLVDAMLDASLSEAAKGQAYNVSPPGKDLSWREYVDALADGLKAKRARLSLPFPLAYSLGAVCELINAALRRKARPMVSRHAVLLFAKDQNYGSAKAVRDFGFKAKMEPAEGLRRSVEWFNAKG